MPSLLPPAVVKGKIKFLAQATLLGCVPPLYVIVEFAGEEIEELRVLFFGLTLFDMAQAIYQPGAGRRRRSGRRGRKRRPRFRIPDPNDIIGRSIRGELNPYDAFRIGPGAWAFRILNFYEGAVFAMAFLEITSEGLWKSYLGAAEVDAGNCARLGYCERADKEYTGLGWVGVSPYPVPYGHLIAEDRFDSTTVQIIPNVPHAQVNFSCEVTPHWANDKASGSMTMQNLATGEVAGSGHIDLNHGDQQSISLSVSAGRFDQVIVQWWTTGGVMQCGHRHTFAHGYSFTY